MSASKVAFIESFSIRVLTFLLGEEATTTQSCGSAAFAHSFEQSLCALSEDNDWPGVPSGGRANACKCSRGEECNRSKGLCDCGEGFGAANGLGSTWWSTTAAVIAGWTYSLKYM